MYRTFMELNRLVRLVRSNPKTIKRRFPPALKDPVSSPTNDEGGRVVGSTVIASTDGRLAAACMTATAKWRYEAGVKGGHAVYSRMRVSFSFGPEGGQERAEGPFVTPVVVYQEQPVYPFSLRLSGIKGKVVVEFIVDPQGNVIQPSVIESSHPDFEAPTIEALLNSKFKPGLKNGHPVFTRMEVPILFQIAYNDGRNGVEAWSIPGKASSSLPEPYRYEEPPRPLLIGAPVYPYELLTKKVRGNAVVGFAIDPSGRPRAVQVESATMPEFGAATAAMVAAWRFDPAMKGGKPSWSLMKREQEFNLGNDDFPVNDSARRLLKALKKTPCPVLSNASALDVPLKGRYQPAPIIPASVEKRGVPVRADIAFIVDHAGHAQLPRISSTDNADFAWAAATAVSRWQFNAPTSKGKPVDVSVAIPIDYKPSPAETPPAAPPALRAP